VTPREREHQIAPKKARHFSLKITHSRRSSVSFDRPLPCESTPEIMVQLGAALVQEIHLALLIQIVQFGRDNEIGPLPSQLDPGHGAEAKAATAVGRIKKSAGVLPSGRSRIAGGFGQQLLPAGSELADEQMPRA
jgi:hypothetical protein